MSMSMSMAMAMAMASKYWLGRLLLMLLRCVPSVCPAAAAQKAAQTTQTAQTAEEKLEETPNCWHSHYINVHYSKIGFVEGGGVVV